jgi:hypothetical protein
MRHGVDIRPAHRFAFLGLMLTLLTSTFAIAGVSGGHKQTVVKPARTVLLPQQSRYSLAYAAELTAYFNNLAERKANQYPRNLPFQLLYEPPVKKKNNTGGKETTFYVRPGTLLYVPVLYNTNAPPAAENFPPAGDRAALINYFYSHNELGLVYARIVVDGKVTMLSSRYLVEVTFDPPGLADGTTIYQTIAGFLAPLSKGAHTVVISALLNGKALGEDGFEFSTTYRVIVR